MIIQVRLANDRHRKYEATTKCVGYQCDLALLEVNDPEFQSFVEPVELGDMVDLRQKIMVVGFPMGGTEISLTKGIVSRIEVDVYVESEQRLLQVQVDAAINPGNSGGPVFSGGKVVGVAFQGMDRPGLGYMIPMPIVGHFLTEAFSGKKYRGFPMIPMVTEELENPYERAHYHLANRTGVRILKVDNLSDAYSKLKPDDILLAVDGLPVSNEGTVDIPGVGKCIDFVHLTQTKFIGDSIKLTILRQTKGPKVAPEELEIEVTLDVVMGDTEKVSVEERDKMPTYYINSGLCFVPLTRNYLHGEGDVFEEVYLFEYDCKLADQPKKNKDEQIVVISHIFKCTETQGYEKHVNTIVKSINGRDINHISDVIAALEGHQTDRHVIALTTNSKIVVPNMPAAQFQRLLKRYHIPADRSEDLVAQPVQAESMRAAAVVIDEHAKMPKKKRPIFSSSSSSDAEEEAPMVPRRKQVEETKGATRGMLPGVKRFMDTIQAMEDRCKDAPEYDDEDDDSEYSYEDIDLENTEAEESELEEAVPARTKPLLHRRNATLGRLNFFKAPKSEDEEDFSAQEKRGLPRGRR